VLEFLKTKLWTPMFTREGYNPYSTILLAFLLVSFVELYWKFFAKKQNQKKLRFAVIPFIVFGGVLRFLDSRALSPRLLTITPGIYFFLAALFTLCIHFFDYKKTRKIGEVLAVIAILFSLPYLNFSKSLFSLAVFPFYFLFTKLYSKLPLMKDSFAWKPHIFEAWITSFGVMAGLMEEHVLAGALMNIHPLLFGLLKSLLIPLIMYLIKDTKGEQKIYIGTIIGLIGLGPGLRDLLELFSL